MRNALSLLFALSAASPAAADSLPSQIESAVLLRDMRSRLNDDLHATDFSGVDALGVKDSTAGLQAAIDAACARGKELYVPAGSYLYTRLTVACSGFRWHGAGRGLTVLRPISSSGDSLVVGRAGTIVSDVKLSDFSIIADRAPMRTGANIKFLSVNGAVLEDFKTYYGAVCIQVENGPTDEYLTYDVRVRRFNASSCGQNIAVGMEGADYSADFTGAISGDILTVSAIAAGLIPASGQVWGGGVASPTKIVAQVSGAPNGVGAYRVDRRQSVSSGAMSASGGGMPADVFFSDGAVGAASVAGVHIASGGGIHLDHLDATSNASALIVDPSRSQKVATLTLHDFEADTSHNDNIKFVGTGPIVDTRITAIWTASSTTGSGIVLDNPSIDGFFVTGGTVSNNAQHGWSLLALKSAQIIGVTSCHNSMKADDAYDGFYVAPGVSSFILGMNKAGGCGNIASVRVANKQKFGVEIAAGASDQYQVVGNDLEGNLSGRLSDGGTGANKVIWGPGLPFEMPAGLVSHGAVLFKDGATKAYPAGIAIEPGGREIRMGINDDALGQQVNASSGGFFRMDTRAEPLFAFHARPAGGTAAAQAFSVDALGNARATGVVEASGFKAGAAEGFSGKKKIGSCTLTFTGGLVTNVRGC